jgi:hypothetical protein
LSDPRTTAEARSRSASWSTGLFSLRYRETGDLDSDDVVIEKAAVANFALPPREILR